MKDHKIYPAVWYTHCLLRRPVKTFEYKWFPFKSQTSIKVFTKMMAVIHDYFLCMESEYGIKYGSITYDE